MHSLTTTQFANNNGVWGDFHVYAFDYLPGCIKFYVDSALMKTAGAATKHVSMTKKARFLQITTSRLPGN